MPSLWNILTEIYLPMQHSHPHGTSPHKEDAGQFNMALNADHDHSLHLPSSLLWPFLLTIGFALVEAIGGLLTGSLALLGDAGHMLLDAAALALAMFASWVARRPATPSHSYGLMRAEVVVALFNALSMLAVVAVIVYEALQRLQSPETVQGGPVMLIAFVGLVVNLLVARHLHQHQHDLNHRAAFLHVLGDLLGSLAALAAGAVIYFTGWMAIDPLLSLLISLLILISTLRLLRETLHVLLEGVPRGLDVEHIQAAMQAIPKVKAVYQIHVWSLASSYPAMTAHIVLEDLQDWPEVLLACQHLLQQEFDLSHCTLQPERFDPALHARNGCVLTQAYQKA